VLRFVLLAAVSRFDPFSSRLAPLWMPRCAPLLLLASVLLLQFSCFFCAWIRSMPLVSTICYQCCSVRGQDVRARPAKGARAYLFSGIASASLLYVRCVACAPLRLSCVALPMHLALLA
jgi:hypothetical protein